jgi:hypothetical protein
VNARNAPGGAGRIIAVKRTAAGELALVSVAGGARWWFARLLRRAG